MRRLPIIISILFCLFIAGCQGAGAPDNTTVVPDNEQHVGQPPDQEVNKPADPLPPVEPEPYTEEATLVAVGDIMVHNPQLNNAYDKDTGTYSFDDYFTDVAPILQTGDWVVANFETTLAGPERGYSGYPVFNTPDELADALKNAGFNILGTANNHTMDSRTDGVLRTLEQLHARDFTVVGTNASQEDAEKIHIVTKNDISIAFLSYTYGTNGIPVPEDKPYLVNLIDEERIARDILKARSKGADVVAVITHFGEEYQRLPNQNQKDLAHKMIDWGADIILGSHTHVVQPYEIVETQDANGHPKTAVIIYSMGNFISNQGPLQGTGLYSDVGVIFKMKIKKHYPEGTIEISNIEDIPTWVHKYWDDHQKRRFRILPLEETVNAQSDPTLSVQDYTMLEGYLEEMNKHIPSMAVPVSESK